MREQDWLAERFEAHRPHLRAVAYRLLGSSNEVDDAVQGAWLRLSRADPSGVENLGGWLTTLVARECLDLLRARTSRREQPLGVRTGDALYRFVGMDGMVGVGHHLFADGADQAEVERAWQSWLAELFA